MAKKKKKSKKQIGNSNLQGKNIDFSGKIAGRDIIEKEGDVYIEGKKAEERSTAMLFLMRAGTFVWVLVIGELIGSAFGWFIGSIALGETDGPSIGIPIGLLFAFIGAIIAAGNVSRYK